MGAPSLVGIGWNTGARRTSPPVFTDGVRAYIPVMARAGAAAATFAAVAVVCSVAALATFGVPVYVCDHRVTASPWNTVDGLIRAAGIDTSPGDLVDVDGALLEQGGGQPSSCMLNGVEAPRGLRARPFDRLSVVPGSAIVEEVRVEATACDPQLQVTGSGSFVEVQRQGRPAKAILKRGVSTGKVLGAKETSPAVPERVVRFQYTCPSKIVVLTFDDGPRSPYTEGILDALKEEKAHAVFFVLGSQAEAHPDLLKRMVDEGHEIGNHTYSHLLSAGSDHKEMEAEITRTSDVVKAATGRPTKWFRPVGGALDYGALRAARDTGHTLVLWNVDPRDWDNSRAASISGAARIVSEVIGRPISNGSVILLHDGGGPRGATVQAVREIIPALKRQGYKFCTLSELYQHLGLD